MAVTLAPDYTSSFKEAAAFAFDKAISASSKLIPVA
jgi:hypothetical protein